MELSLYFISNTILFVICLSMGTMFLAMPLPQKFGFSNYKISLKVLASSYYILALLTFITTFFKLPDNGRELFTYTNINISSFQVLLFSNALITLLNPKFVTKRYLLIQLLPYGLFAAIFIISYQFFGNPVITKHNELSMYLSNPTLWVRLSFYLFYLFQIIFYTWLFFSQEKKFKQRAMNYFSDERWLKATWVRIAYLAALCIGIISISAYLAPPKWDWAFNFVYSLFYLGFALEYIKYHKIFKQLEPIVNPLKTEQEKPQPKPRIKTEWPVLKQQIIKEQYFLESGINIENIAQRVNIGRTTLSNLINREEGVNFNTWINSLRIERAKELLLANPNEALSSIAEKTGYSEQANFSRQFRQVTGYAPTLWRQKNS